MDLVKARPQEEHTSTQVVWAALNTECFQGVSFKGRGEIKHTEVNLTGEA